MINQSNIILTAKDITKYFPGVIALTKVSFNLFKCEIHAIVGENGAGKSTLMQILAGIYKKDEGTVTIDGVEHDLANKREAEKAGISIVFQESSLLQNVSVHENLFSGEPPVNNAGFINWKAVKKQGAELLKKVDVDIDSSRLAGSFSAAIQKMIEIARAISKEFKILILDEPTASITIEETEQLFSIIKALRESGKSIIYISHRIKEIKDIADRVSVLKDGRCVGTFKIDDVTEEEICEKMVGRKLINFKYKSQIKDEVVLKVNNLSGESFTDISFSLKKGEFLAITGLTGAGRTELALSIYGYQPVESGTIEVHGKKCRINSPRDAMKVGIGYATEDRKKLGLFMSMSIQENMESNNIDKISSVPFSIKKLIENMASKNVLDFNIQCSNPAQTVNTLSGGNQQKVCLSRWVSYKPEILIVDEPTLGVDVGSKEEIYNILNQLTREGMSIIMISSDMIETLTMGDRVMVMHDGNLMRILNKNQSTEKNIIALASGIKI